MPGPRKSLRPLSRFLLRHPCQVLCAERECGKHALRLTSPSMRPFVAMFMSWSAAAYCFYNTYYGIRYPEKYIKAKWTIMRGLPRERDSASTGAAISALVGALFFGGGLTILHSLL